MLVLFIRNWSLRNWGYKGQMFKKLEGYSPNRNCRRGNFRIFDFLLSISIYSTPYSIYSTPIYSTPYKRVFENCYWSCKTDLVLLNSCSFWPKFDVFLRIFHLPLLITPPPKKKRSDIFKSFRSKRRTSYDGGCYIFDWLIE